MFSTPVGDLSLFIVYDKEILESKETSAPEWAQKFSLWDL